MTQYDIFISYSRADANTVGIFKRHLEDEGLKVWMDLDGIESGEAFKRVIVKAIKGSKVLVFFSSKDSNASVWTAKEIGMAVKYKKVVIPVLLDDSKFNEEVEFDLVGVDYIDASLSTTSHQQEIERLVRALRKHITFPPKKDPKPKPEPKPKPRDGGYDPIIIHGGKKKKWSWKWFGIIAGGIFGLLVTIIVLATVVSTCSRTDISEEELSEELEPTEVWEETDMEETDVKEAERSSTSE